MINTLSILVGLFGIMFVVARATMLDKKLPWFKPVPPPPPKSTHGPGMRR